MHVGIFLSEGTPLSGGGYTFEQEIFHSILEAAADTDHLFTVFSRQPIKNFNASSPTNIRYSVLPRRSVIERILKFFVVNFCPSSPFLISAFFRTSTRELEFKKKQIDIAIFISPFHEPTEIPYITIVWDLQHRLQPSFPEVIVNGEWQKRENLFSKNLQQASYVITGNETGKNEIMLFYGIPHDRIKILPHPTPHDVLESVNNNNFEIKLKYELNAQYLIYPAQFWPHKNHINLLLAFKKLRDRNVMPLLLVFVGSDKGNLSYIHQMIKNLQLEKDVRILGFVPREDLIELYRNAFAMVYPSFFGPENLPPLEAFALGCPVVASKVPGAEEQMKKAAIFFNPADPDDMAKSLERIIHDEKLRHEMVMEGNKLAHMWTGKEFVREMISIIDEFEKIRRCWN